MTIKDLLDEYAECYRVVDNCEDDGYGCKMCLEERERMAEIIKEIEASVRREVIEDILNIPKQEGRVHILKSISVYDIKEYALSIGIDLTTNH